MARENISYSDHQTAIFVLFFMQEQLLTYWPYFDISYSASSGTLDRGLCGSVSIVCQRIIVFDKACIKPLFLAIHEPSNEMSPCQPGVFCVGNVLLERRGDFRADSILHEKLQNQNQESRRIKKCSLRTTVFSPKRFIRIDTILKWSEEIRSMVATTCIRIVTYRQFYNLNSSFHQRNEHVNSLEIKRNLFFGFSFITGLHLYPG